MSRERETVLHSWCVQAEWQAPTVVGGEGARLFTEDGARSSNEQPGRVQQPRATSIRTSSRRSARRPSGCASSPPPGARSRARGWREMLLEKSGFEGGRVFFTLGGADANEHAVKFARQARGKPRGKVITRDRSYHGASYAAMALSGDARTRTQVDAAAFDVLHVPPPYAYRCPFGSDERRAMRRARRRGASRDCIDRARRGDGRRGDDGAQRRHQRHRRARTTTGRRCAS